MEFNGVSFDNISLEDKLRGETLTEIKGKEYSGAKIKRYEKLDSVKIGDGISWEEYLDRIENYSEIHFINLNNDPFEDLLSSHDKAIIANMVKNDYTRASNWSLLFSFLLFNLSISAPNSDSRLESLSLWCSWTFMALAAFTNSS